MSTRSLPGLLTAAGIAIVLISSAIGFVRAFTMDMSAGHREGSHAVAPLSGMALSDMPEMFVAPVGLVLVLIGGLLRTRTRRPETQWLGRGRVPVAIACTAALTIDISKTSTLGFVVPGMRAEYGLTPRTASLLAVAGLAGTAIGAVLIGNLADRIGRRTSYLLATLGFTATSMCGTMPTFGGNVVMCALMGMAVGGLAPLLVTVLSETLGGASGPAVVGLSVIATAIGYLVAAGSALWLEPIFGWRVLWLIGAPSGALLVLLTPCVPERRWTHRSTSRARTPAPVRATAFSSGLQRTYALLVGVLTFGLTTWVPTLARLGDVSAARANLLLTVAAVVMVPCSLVIMVAYRRFGAVPTAAGLAGFTAVLLAGLALSGVASIASWVSVGALVMALFSVNIMAAVFLPITAELTDPDSRARTTGKVSLYNRIGGLCGPLLLAGLVSSAGDVLVAVSVLAGVCAIAAGYMGRQYRRLPGGPDTGGRVATGPAADRRPAAANSKP